MYLERKVQPNTAAYIYNRERSSNCRDTSGVFVEQRSTEFFAHYIVNRGGNTPRFSTAGWFVNILVEAVKRSDVIAVGKVEIKL